MPYCLLFPGQGTQFPGMAEGLALSGMDDDLLRLMRQGPEEELSRTINAQPAVLAASLALWQASGYSRPAMVMGHSLGEYTALAAVGAIPFAAAIELVRQRGRFMEQAEPGAMAAVMGLALEDIRDIINAIPDVWIANLNSPAQTVLSGRQTTLAEATPLLKAKGAKVMPLKVSVASHCPLMASARSALAAYLEQTEIGIPQCPVIFNASARPEDDPERIRTLLADQLVSPVRWIESITYALEQGIDHFIEIGPKSVLAGMVKRIVPQARIETRTVA